MGANPLISKVVALLASEAHERQIAAAICSESWGRVQQAGDHGQGQAQVGRVRLTARPEREDQLHTAFNGSNIDPSGRAGGSRRETHNRGGDHGRQLLRNKLGKKPAHHDPRTLQMANYLELPQIPAARDWTTKAAASWGMMLNDKLGDCTCAAVGHIIQAWSSNAAAKEITLPDQAILKTYEAVSGYNPSDPSSDRGAVELDVLRYWRKTGVGGYKIDAFVALEPKNHLHVQASVDLFGGSYIGLALPVSAQSQQVWSVPPGGPTGTGRRARGGATRWWSRPTTPTA